ncbi:hypothetical protein ABZ215_31550 [Amycolatopsis sp. NPDC006131]|uniref:hypothetical protein n=1 Tax=Amycolatopsis sp. NPDC006131 TaxID=3156731 RepID=UPI0033BE5AEC
MIKDYRDEVVAAQPIGAWSGEAYRLVVGALREDLVARGWMTEADGLTLTESGEAGRLRARDRNARVHERMHEGEDPADFVTTINVLRRMVANLGGDGNLPD